MVGPSISKRLKLYQDGHFGRTSIARSHDCDWESFDSLLNGRSVLEILKTRGMEMKTRKTITDPAKYLRELEKGRKFDFALVNEENPDGVRWSRYSNF